jgi:hypothetical protein
MLAHSTSKSIIDHSASDQAKIERLLFNKRDWQEDRDHARAVTALLIGVIALAQEQAGDFPGTRKQGNAA